MRLLDLFCCQGGAGKGYADAGFEVTGVDNVRQPRYPFDFYRMDALLFLRNYGQEFDVIHASPPCQGYSKAQRLRGNTHERLIAAVRDELERTGKPYIIENVMDACSELRDPVMLCGTMFGLALYRHRLFETNWPLTAPLHGEHYLPQVKMGRKPKAGELHQPVGNFSDAEGARVVMGMPWASRDGLREAIPPAYTEWIGSQLLQALNDVSVPLAPGEWVGRDAGG